MKTTLTIVPLLALTLLAAPAAAQELTPTNPQVDYLGFSKLVQDLGPIRDAHRLPWPEFAKRARADGAVLLDARSATAFARGHLDGAVNLPFSDFTPEALREVLGDDPQRPIFIYCNNNFTDHRAPIALKAAPLALNIPTFINLHGYGYRNVWELGGLVSAADPQVGWVADFPLPTGERQRSLAPSGA